MFGIFWILVWLLAFGFWLSDQIFFSGILGKHSGSGEIDTGISSAVKNSTKPSMAKNVLDGWVETTITAEKEACFKRNTTDLWKKYVFFKQQACNFSIEKSNMPEMTIFYLNQAYQSSKGNKKSDYSDLFILGQVTPCLNPPENLNSYDVKKNEAKTFRPKYDTVSGQFLGLVETLGYLTAHGDSIKCFLDYGYSKEQ